MIIKLDYRGDGLSAIKTKYNGKEKYHYIRFVVDEFSVDEAIEYVKGNKWVVALDYEGDLQYLFNLKTRPSIPLIVRKNISLISEITYDLLKNSVPNWVILSLRMPKDFCDMRFIAQISEEFPNVRFCGGSFLRLPCCNVGCIMKKDIPNKVVESEVHYYTEGCACIIETMNIDKVQEVEYIYDTDLNETEGQKKVVSSINDLILS